MILNMYVVSTGKRVKIGWNTDTLLRRQFWDSIQR